MAQKGAHLFREKEKRGARRRNCVDSTPAKRIFVFTVTVPMKSLRFLLELWNIERDFANSARKLVETGEKRVNSLEFSENLQEYSRFCEKSL